MSFVSYFGGNSYQGLLRTQDNDPSHLQLFLLSVLNCGDENY